MAKITCALSASQIKNLFQYTYQTMLEASEAGEAFEPNAFMKNVFDSISESKDVDTAIKFVQQLPTLIYSAAGTNALVDMDFDVRAVRSLISKYKNPETGFAFVVNTYAPQVSADEVLNQIASVSESGNEVPETDEVSEKVDPLKLKAFTAFSSTFMEFVPINPREEGILDKQIIDVNKIRIYNTLTEVRRVFNSSENNINGTIYYQGQRLKLRAVRLSDLDPAMLDETTAAQVGKSIGIVKGAKDNKVKYEGEIVTQAKDRVALVLSDDNGEFLYFDEEGKITSQQDGGKLVYQFMRVVRPEANNPSRLKATNIYGKPDVILSPEELFDVEAKYFGMKPKEYAEYLELEGSSKTERVAELDKEQQAEFKAVKAFTDKITKSGETELIAFTGVSLGVPRDLVRQNPTFGQIQSVPFVSKSDFQDIRIVKEPRDGFNKGAYTIKLNDTEFQVDRPDMTADIANKIAHALTNPNLSNKDKYLFISYFMSNSVSENDTVKRYNIYYNEAKDELEFKLRPDTVFEADKKGTTKQNGYVKIELVPENFKTIYDGLMEGRFYKGRKPSKMTYNEQALLDNAYYDYDVATGKLNRRPSKYVDLIMSFSDTEIYVVEDKNPGFFNSYMNFSLDNSYTQEVDEAVKEVEKSFTIKEKKAAIVKALGEGKALTGAISKQLNAAGNETTTQWQFTDSKGSVVNFYNHNTNEKSDKYAGKTATLVLMEPMTGRNGEYYPSPVAVYVDNKLVGYLQEKGYSKGDEVIEAQAEGTEAVITEPTQEIPIEKTIEQIDQEILAPDDITSPDDDEGFSFGLDRSATLPNNVTQEQIDAAKQWWDNSPLSKFVSIEHMANIVNSNVFARFVASGKKLATPGKLAKIQINEATNGNYVDVYHEAWHAFSQLFLTKKDKLALYNEVRNSNPKWKNLSFLQLEELIAEDFRTYALDPKAVKNMPKRNTIFRKIINFLKSLFGGKKNINNVSEVRSVKELYEKLYFADKNPNLLKNYQPLVDNVMWNILNRGPESISNKEEDFLNAQDGKLVAQSIDSIFSKIIDKNAKATNNKAGAVTILSDQYVTSSGVTNRDAAYVMAKKEMANQLNMFVEEAKSIGSPQTPEEDARLDVVKNNIRILSAAINNWGDAKSGMVKYHMEKTTFDIVNQKATVQELITEESEEEDSKEISSADTEVTTEKFDSSVGDKSLDQLADKDTLYILKSLFKIDANGQTQKNILGFDVLADFPTVWNNVVRAIGGVKDPETMYAKLMETAKTFPELKQLIEFKLPNPSDIKNTAEMAITTGFWQSFKKSRVPYVQLTWFKQKDGTYAAEVTEASNQTSSVIYKFKNKFNATDPTKFIGKTNKNNSILKLDEIVKAFAPRGKFNTKESWEFVRAIGISLDDLTIIKKTLEDNPNVYGLEYLFKIVKKFNELDNDVNASKEAKEYVKKFKEDPITTLTNIIPEGILDKKEVLEKNLIEKLASLQGRYGADSSNFSVLNAERKLVFEHIEDFSASMQVDAINSVKNIKDLWLTDRYQFMSYLNPNTNSFTMRSKVLNSLFILDTQDEKYDRRRDRVLALSVVSGSQLDDNTTGANTTSLDKYGKFIQEMHMMLKGGLQEFMRHASKSSSFGVQVDGGIVTGRGKGSDKHLYVDIDKFATEGEAEMFTTDNIFIDYIASELERIIKFRANIDEYRNYSGYNRVMKDGKGKEIGLAGEFFTAFDNVLSEATKDALINNRSEMDIRNEDFLHYYLDKNPAVRDMILKDVTQYFNDQTDTNVNFFNKNSYVDEALSNRLNVFKLTPEQEQRALIKAFTVNSWIHNFEMANLFYSDVTQFDHSKDELHKRIPGATSSGLGFRSDLGAQKYVNNVLNAQEVDLNTGAIVKANTYAGVLNKLTNSKRYDNFNYTGKLNTAVLRDIERKSAYIDEIYKGLKEDYEARFANATKEDLLEQLNKKERTASAKMTKDQLKEKIITKRLEAEIDPYKKMNEADGQGYITFDAYRTLRVLANRWSKEQENLYQKIIAGESIATEQITKFFPVYKLQHFGPLANTPLPVTAMHKFALFPLIPSVIKNSELESLHQQMLAQNIQYATFESGSKVGNKFSQRNEKGQAVADQIYSDPKQTELIRPDRDGENGIQFTKNTIYVEYLKDVTSVPDKFKQKTIFATQLRKLILEGLYKQGGLTNKEYKNFSDDYEKAVDEYSDILRLEILNEIGYAYKDGKYQGDLSKFLEVVNRELERKEIPQHLIDYIGVTGNNNVTNDLSYHLEAEDIESIIVSLLTKRLIKQKVKGEALVQVASTMTKGLWGASPKFTKATDDEIKKYLGSNNLPFYKYSKDGTSAMKVAVAMQGDFNNLFKAKHLDDSTIGVYDTETVTGKDGKEKKVQRLRFQESLDRLNELIKNDEWLEKDNNRKLITMTSVRIPVQGLNSMEFMEVHHFLSPEAGGIIIPPSEIVAKSGADYDVDKLTTFMPNIDTDGKFTESTANTEDIKRIVANAENTEQATRIIATQKAAIENRLIQSTRNILALPTNYANLVRPNETYLLKEIADELEDNVTDYNKYATSHDEGPRLTSDKKGNPKKVISPTKVFEVGFNIYKQEVNMGGKKGLGIVALKNAIKPIFNSLGARMPKTYKAAKWNDKLKRYEEGIVDHDMRLLLPHNTVNGAISLSNLYDKYGIDRISDLYSQMMNGLVDVEKDSWIFNIQGNIEVIPVLTYLFAAGVPRQVAVNFVSQPLVREYVERQRIMNSPYAAITGNVPQEMASVKGQAVADVMQVPEYVLTEANVLKLIDAVKYSAADRFDVSLREESGSTEISKNELLQLITKMGDVTEFSFIKPTGEKKSLISPLDKTPMSTTNYYYTSKAASTYVDQFNLNSLRELIDENDTTSYKAIAAFTHFLEIEKQIEGLEALQRVANPDTKTFKTIEEIIQREYDLDRASIMSKLDPDLVAQLKEDSILSKFFDNELVKDLLEPLFILRNNKAVSDYITDALQNRKDKIAAKYGFGEDATRSFINEFKNAIVNYAYQNHMANSINDEGVIVDVPEMHNDLFVVKGKAVNGARVEGNKIIIDMDVLNKDFSAERFERNSTDADSYSKRGLKSMSPGESMFATKSQFIKFVMEREYLRSTTPVESLNKNKNFLRTYSAAKSNNISDEKSKSIAYETYIAQQALYNSFNRNALLMSEEFSYSNNFFKLLEDYPALKDKYPVLMQFSEPKIASGEKVLTLNNKSIVKGELAEDYHQNLLELADPNVVKVKDPAENQRISEFFEMLPLVSLFINGIGYSKYGINKVLPYDEFMGKMFSASKIFTDHNMNNKTFDDIFNKILGSRSIFKNYASEAVSTTSLPEEPQLTVTQTVGGGLAFGDIPVEVNIEQPKSVPSIDISSNAKGLGGGLTNPTELSKAKGNIVNSYPVEFNGVVYKDAEAAYQANKKDYKMEGQGEGTTYDLMVQIITAKFLQHPRLIAATNDAGGSDFILNAIHQPTKKNTIWETNGGNYFILALNEAYLNAKSLRNKPAAQPTTKVLKDYTNHSGGAKGSDTEWDVIGKEFGMVNNKHYYTGEKGPGNAPLGNEDITDQPIAVEGASKVAQAAKEMWGYKYTTMKDQRLIRNWAQVANSDAVFAIGTLGKEGDIWKGDEKSAEPRKLLKFAVQGGTGYAVEMAIQAGKPVYVFDQVRDQWYQNIDGEWSKTEVPVLTENFAGIGTREINEAGKQAIRDVYENTLSQTAEPGMPSAPTKLTSTQLSTSVERKTYSGKVTSLQPNQIFVFGSNPEGRHGAGAAKYAKDNFGAVYGQGEGLQGQSYALPTKDLRIKANNSLRSISAEDITESIKKLYEVARQNPTKEFLVSDYSESNLNGYTGQEMADMFKAAGNMPSNIVFNGNFDKLVTTTQPTVEPVGTVKEGVTELFEANPGLATIGTPEQYSEWINYLTTQGKLAGTQATDILYHGTYEEFEEFDEEKKGANTGINTYQSEDKSEQFYSDSAHTIFFSDRKTNAISYTLLGRDKYLSEILDALQDIRSGVQELVTDAAEVLKGIPYFNNLIEKAKQEGKTSKEIIELLGKEETKLAKKYKPGSSSLFTNELAGYENSLKELNKFLSNIDVFKKTNDINFTNSTSNFRIFTKDGKVQFARFDKGRTIKTGERFYADQVNDNKIKEFIKDAIAEDNSYYNQAKIKMKEAGFEEKAIPVLLNLQNPSIHDYEKSSFPDAYKDTKTRTAAFAAKQVADAIKNGNDGVIYENIVDPLLSNSYGVFKTEQIYILGGKEDKTGFSNFVNNATTGQLSLFDDPYTTLSNFYNTLTAVQKEKIGTLEDLYEEYLQMPSDYSIEDFVDNKKTCKL